MADKEVGTEELSLEIVDSYITSQSRDIEGMARLISKDEAAMKLQRDREDKRINDRKRSLALKRQKLEEAKAKKDRILKSLPPKETGKRKHPNKRKGTQARKAEHTRKAAAKDEGVKQPQVDLPVDRHPIDYGINPVKAPGMTTALPATQHRLPDIQSHGPFAQADYHAGAVADRHIRNYHVAQQAQEPLQPRSQFFIRGSSLNRPFSSSDHNGGFNPGPAAPGDTSQKHG